jgi:Icc-related predicted phosphoesterase
MRRHPEIPFWLCVGDVGDDAGVYQDVAAPLYWIKGNNESFDFVARPASAGNDSGDRFPNLRYIPNGRLIEIDGLRVAGVGGTFAPTWYDKPASALVKKGKDDKRRHFVKEEVEAVKAVTGLDVLLTHEAPRPFRIGGYDAGKTPVNEMIASTKPKLHLFGHHHRFVEMTVSGARSVCLDVVSRSYLLVKREGLTYERVETTARG